MNPFIASIASLAAAATGVVPAAPIEAAAEGTAAPVRIALEIHVENSIDPPAEMRTVADMARAATRHGIDLTFSLDETMLRYLATAPAALKLQLARWEANGHSFGLHAGMDGLSTVAAEAHLAAMAADFTAAFRHAPTTVSGACTGDSDWISPVIDNGLTVVAGTITYCEHSLDPTAYAGSALEAEVLRSQARCTSPGRCHDPAPASDDTQRVIPWTTSDAATWLTPDAGGAVTIVSTLGSTSMECGSEGRAGSCAFDATGDAAAFVSLTGEARMAGGGSSATTLHMAWSTNNRPERAYVEELFTAIAGSISAAGPVEWTTLAGLAA